MKKKCNKCGSIFDLISVEAEAQPVNNMEKYYFPIFMNGQEFAPIRCKCGRIYIYPIEN